jgi:hypothetical protein
LSAKLTDTTGTGYAINIQDKENTTMKASTGIQSKWGGEVLGARRKYKEIRYYWWAQRI